MGWSLNKFMYSVKEVKRNCCLLKNESQPLLKNPFNYISSLHFFLLNSFSVIFIAASKIKLIFVNWLLKVNRLLRSCCLALSVIRWGVGCILFAELSGHICCCWQELLHFGLMLAFLLSVFQTSCEYLYMFSCTALSAYFVTMHPPPLYFFAIFKHQKANYFLQWRLDGSNLFEAIK